MSGCGQWRRVTIATHTNRKGSSMVDSYEAPALTVLGEVAELTEGGSSGGPDQTDGNGSAQVVSDGRLKRAIRAL
jgi:hypothetical protein